MQEEGLNSFDSSTDERSPFNVSMGTIMYKLQVAVSHISLSLATGRVFIQTRPPTQTPQSGAIPQILYVREEEKTIRMEEYTWADIITTNKNVRYVSLGTRFIFYLNQ